MKKHMLVRIGIILCSIILSVIVLIPCLTQMDPSNDDKDNQSTLSNFLPNTKINLGLDLKGGVYLALGIKVDKVITNSLVRIGQDVKSVARNQYQFIIVNPQLSLDNKLEIIAKDANEAASIKEILNTDIPGIIVASAPTSGGGEVITVDYTPEQKRQIEHESLTRAMDVIQNRVDQFGVAEPDIRLQEEEQRIIIQLPGLEDEKRAIALVGQTAHLQFMLEHTPKDTTEISRLQYGIMPNGVILLSLAGRADVKYGDPDAILLDTTSGFTGEYIDTARQSFDERGLPAVSLHLTKSGAKIFEDITAANENKRLAIVLDGKINSAPNINGRIAGGQASITGHFSMEQANDLALVLRSGSLPAPVEVLEQRVVGPSLGQDAIDKGITAALVGWGLITLFIIVYYGLSGIIAALMMAFDVILLLAGMAAMGATLTLPGIAGIVLTIGMAVDANVLIFERIREELRLGFKPIKAIDIGFSRATLTILDSNLTTIIATMILYNLGTGPVRGFAVTLTLGIIASMFTAIFVSRTIFDLWIKNDSKKISI